MSDLSKRKSVADDAMFITLIRVAREDPEIKRRLCAILSLDRFNRASYLNSFLHELRLKGAPAPLTSAVSVLLNDQVAKKAFSVIQCE